MDWLDADPANRKYFDGLDNMLNAARVNHPPAGNPSAVRSQRCASMSAWSMRICQQSCAYVSGELFRSYEDVRPPGFNIR
ncbi:MAG: hypothetical protein ACLRM8_02125 [Alistipes sp.]